MARYWCLWDKKEKEKEKPKKERGKGGGERESSSMLTALSVCGIPLTYSTNYCKRLNQWNLKDTP